MTSFPNKFRVSLESTDRLKYLKSKTGLTPNLLCRFALSSALRDGAGIGNASVVELGGQEFNTGTLFGEHVDIYEMLIRQFMHEQELEVDMVRCVASLIENGLHRMGHVRSLKELTALAI